MCDNNKNFNKKCSACNNDTVGCNSSNLKHVIANNFNIMQCFKNIKCQVLAYINSLSVEFIQNINFDNEPVERARLNALIESLISGIHQSVRSYTDGQTEPYFQLWIQKETSSPEAASCSVNTFTTKEDCEDALGTCSSGGHTTRSTCEAAGETFTPTRTWTDYVPAGKTYDLGAGIINNGDESDDYDAGNRTNLYPNKISLLVNCNQGGGVKGGEIIYQYIPTLQLLYNPNDSSLIIRWGDVETKKQPIMENNCLFPLLSDPKFFKSEVLTIVPPSYSSIGELDDSEVWDSQKNIYNFVKNNLLLKNVSLLNFIANVDQTIRKCELTNSTLQVKLKMEDKGL